MWWVFVCLFVCLFVCFFLSGTRFSSSMFFLLYALTFHDVIFFTPEKHPWYINAAQLTAGGYLGLLLYLSCYEQNFTERVCANVSIVGYIFLWTHSRSGKVGLYGSSVFNILIYQHSDFFNSWTTSYSYQQWIKVPIPSHASQYLLFLTFLMISIPIGMR